MGFSKKRTVESFEKLASKALTQSNYLTVAALVFLFFSLVSFFIFRQREMSLSVSLAKVEFRPELKQNFETKSQVKAWKGFDIPVKNGGKLETLLAKSGDLVKKDQVLGMLDETQNRVDLLAALDGFKKDPSKENRTALETVKQKVEQSILRSPADGTLWLEAKLGDVTAAGKSIGQVDDVSKLILPLKTKEAIGREIPPQAKVTVSLSTPQPDDKPQEISAEIHYSSVGSKNPDGEVDLEVALPQSEILTKWLRQPVDVKVQIRDLKQVALIEKSAVVTKDKESKILVVGTSGTLHWQKISNALIVEDRYAVKNVDPNKFRVVVPENIERLNKAVTLSVKPSIKGG